MSRRLLILEDDALLAKHLRRLFSARGYEVRAASSVSEFLMATALDTFDVVLLDLSLPDGTGLEAWASARSGQPTARAVLMTAYGNDDAVACAHRLGVSAILSKPVDLPVLLSAVATA